MAISKFRVNLFFPNGLNLDVLIREMPTVWPEDLFPAQYGVNARKSGPRGVTRGLLEIETPRAITEAESAAATTHLQPIRAEPQGSKRVSKTSARRVRVV